jgi:hypothetical protein
VVDRVVGVEVRQNDLVQVFGQRGQQRLPAAGVDEHPLVAVGHEQAVRRGETV